MDTLLSMAVFRQIVESGTFTAAADKLDMSVAMVSKHVRYLEGRVGAQLLHRTSRRVSLSPSGQVYYERCCEVLNTLDETESEIRTSVSQPQGMLRFTAPTWFATEWFADVLTSYGDLFPKVQLDAFLSDERVDLVEQGIDLALRVTMLLEARKLGPIEFGIVGSRAYLDINGRPVRPEQLMQHRMVAYAYEATHLFGFPLPAPAMRSSNTTLMAQLVSRGAGLAIVPKLVITSQPDWTDTFEFVLPDVALPQPNLYAVTHSRRRLSARVSTFLDFLGDRLNRPDSSLRDDGKLQPRRTGGVSPAGAERRS